MVLKKVFFFHFPFREKQKNVGLDFSFASLLLSFVSPFLLGMKTKDYRKNFGFVWECALIFFFFGGKGIQARIQTHTSKHADTGRQKRTSTCRITRLSTLHAHTRPEAEQAQYANTARF